jgi:sugar phosphate permease
MDEIVRQREIILKEEIRQSNLKVFVEHVDESEVEFKTKFKWKSEFLIELGMKEKLLLLLSNKAFMYLLAAAFFRFMGGYSLGYWAKNYFSGVYPENENEFATVYFFILVLGGIPSELIGGYIGDKYEPSIPGIKGYLSAAGAFLGSIFIVFTFILETSFWWKMVFYYLEYLFAEVFFGPSYAQINKLISS